MIELPSDVVWHALRLLAIGSCGAAGYLLCLRAATACVVEFKRWDLGLLRVCFLALARAADESEAITLCLLGREAVTLAVLPDTAPVTSNTVSAIVHVLAVLAAYRAVEIPVTIVFGELLELFLVLFLLSLSLALRSTLCFSCVFSILSLSLESIVLQLGKFFLV